MLNKPLNVSKKLMTRIQLAITGRQTGSRHIASRPDVPSRYEVITGANKMIAETNDSATAANLTAGINFEGTSAPGSGGATVANNILVDNGLLQQVGGGTPSGMPGNLRFDAMSLNGDAFDYILIEIPIEDSYFNLDTVNANSIEAKSVLVGDVVGISC